MIENLWAGWRMAFLQNPTGMKEALDPKGCVLCAISFGGESNFDRNHYVLFRGDLNFVVLNAFPYAAGHLMVVPYLHEGDMLKLDSDTVSESFDLVRKSITALNSVYSPEGFNFGANIGHAGGAAFGDHIHFHVVPRWLGDTNFMTTLVHSRVIPEALSATYDRLHEYF